MPQILSCLLKSEVNRARFLLGLNPYSVIGILWVAISGIILFPSGGKSQALNIPTQTAGISIGNSKLFNGLRFNFRDRNVEKINGVNITLWQSKQNKDARVNGISLGVLPTAGYLRGINLGIIGNHRNCG
jgi:hypothetical protein